MRSFIHRALAWLLVVNVAISGGVVPAAARTDLSVPGVSLKIGGQRGLTLGRGGVIPPVVGGNSSRMMFGSTRSGWPLSVATPSAGQEARVSKTCFFTPDYPITKVSPVFSNFKLTADGRVYPEGDLDGSNVSQPAGDIGNPITVQRLALQIGSTYYQVPFDGTNAGGTIPDGGTAVVPAYNLQTQVAGRTKACWIVGDVVSAGQNQPGGLDRQNNNGEQVARAASLNSGWFDGSVAIPNGSNIGAPGVNTGRTYGPITTLTDGWDGRPVVYEDGDSMAAAANDIGNFTPDSGVQGFLARGLDSNANGAQRYPHFNGAVGGTRPTGMTTRDVGKYYRRGQAFDAMRAVNASLGILGSDGKGATPFTNIASEHINNDASGGNSAAGLQTIMDNYWAFLKAQYPDAGILQTSAMTANYSDTAANTNTGQWTTLESQAPRTADTIPGTGARWIVNDAYLNNKPAVLAATIDVSSYLMDVSARKWKVRAYTGALAADYTSGLTVSLTTAPTVGEAIVVGAGTASAARPNMVTAVSGSGPYTVTLFNQLLVPNTSSTVQPQTAGAPVKASGAVDGLHASPIVHAETAMGVVQAKLDGKFVVTGGTAPAPTAAPANTSLPTISGSTSLNSVLTAGSGTWSNSPTSYAYQWLRNGVAISGETNQMHIVSSADQGTTLTVRVTASNAVGPSSPATSAGLAIPAAATPSAKTMDSTATTMDSALITMDAN